MRHFLRLLLLSSILLLLLTACTRNRPTPEPTATATLLAAPVSAPVGSDPAVEQATATPVAEATGETPTPTVEGQPETFEYRVTQGETLFSIASKFETDVDTVRKLNFLIDDNIIVGQILLVPYKAGMTEAGAPTPTPPPFRYTVAAGDTLSLIARQFGVTTVSIIEVNGLVDPNSLVAGQEIIIPGYQPPAESGETAGVEETGTEVVATPSAAAGGGAQVTHLVQPGEGLLGIAELYGVDAAAIAQANNISNRDVLRAGQQLIIPGVTTQQAARARGAVHVVQAGETVSAIAIRYGVTVDEILTSNAISNANQIIVGQELVIPTP